MIRISITAALLFMVNMSYATPVSINDLYQKNCASCHGANRLGGMGPALLPENLKRLRQNKAIKVVSNGRAATQMPAFVDRLSAKEIQSLVKYVYTPLAKIPKWEMDDINKSHITHFKANALSNKPIFKADMLNLFIVVELGDHSATLLDGDKFEPIHRFKTRFALHGGPKYSPDGRYVYFASRDGWISKFDIYNLKTVAEIRAGINTRNVAVSGDGKTVLIGNYLPHNLVVLNAETLKPIKVIPVEDKKGKENPLKTTIRDNAGRVIREVTGRGGIRDEIRRR